MNSLYIFNWLRYSWLYIERGGTGQMAGSWEDTREMLQRNHLSEHSEFQNSIEQQYGNSKTQTKLPNPHEVFVTKRDQILTKNHSPLLSYFIIPAHPSFKT